jgi:uncharacterized protein (DUF433 family)
MVLSSSLDERREHEENAMTEFNWRERISIKPTVCHGRPCIRRTRIWVSLVLDFLANGETIEQILEGYPQLTEEDVRACLAYGAEMSREQFVPLPMDS